VCARFDFEAAATRLGMRMTIDGSGDEQIRLEGVESYSFCDADGGASGCESEEEGAEAEEEAEEAEAAVEEAEAAEATEEAHEPPAPAETTASPPQADRAGRASVATSLATSLATAPAMTRAATRGASASGSPAARAPTTRMAARAPATKAAAARGGGGTKRAAPAEAATQPWCKRPKKAADGKGAGASAATKRGAKGASAGLAGPAEAARKTVASLLPRAVAPAGYSLVAECPPLETAQQRRALVGRRLLHGWDDGVRHGWFVGRVVRSGVTPGDLRQVPTANFVVRYAAQQTGGELNGLVACEFSPRTHGVDQWWVLLE